MIAQQTETLAGTAPHCEPAGLADVARLVRDLLELDRLRAAHRARCREQHLRPAVHDAVRERLAGKAAKDDRVHRADARACQHRDRQLADHGQVDGDGVAGANALALEPVRDAADLLAHLRVGHRLAVLCKRC